MTKEFKLKWTPKNKSRPLFSIKGDGNNYYNDRTDSQHPECRENEVFFSNYPTGKDYSLKHPDLPSLRCGKQAYDSQNRPLAQSWIVPWFVDKEEYKAHDKREDEKRREK